MIRLSSSSTLVLIVTLGTFLLSVELKSQENAPKPAPLTITHLVPSEGADLSGYVGMTGPTTSTVNVITKPDANYRFVKLPAIPPILPAAYSRVVVGSFDPRVAWEIEPNTAFLSKGEATVFPGRRVNVRIEGKYTPITPGEGEPPEWTTNSVEVDLDGDTNRDGEDNLKYTLTTRSKAPGIAEATEDAAEDHAPGMIVPLDYSTDKSQYAWVVLRRFREPHGKLTVDWEPVPTEGQPGGGVEIRYLGQPLPKDKDLFNDTATGDIWIRVHGIKPGPVKLTATYEFTGNKMPGTIIATDTIYATVVACRIIRTPKVVAADANADVPVYFKIDGLDEVYIHNIDVSFSAGGVQFPDFHTKGAFVAGDAVLKNNGDGPSNGKQSDYTVFIDPNQIFRKADLPNSSGTSTAEYIIDVKINIPGDKSNAVFSLTSQSQPIKLFMDKTLEVVEMGLDGKEVKEFIAPSKKETKQLTRANKNGTPYLRYFDNYVSELGLEYTFKDPQPRVDRLPNVLNRDYYECDVFADRRVTSDTNNGYSIKAFVQTTFSDRNPPDDFTSSFVGEVRGIYFCNYYGKKTVPALDGTHVVVDIRQLSATYDFSVLTDANWTMTVADAKTSEDVDFGKLLSASLGAATSAVALFSSPEPFTKIPVTLVLASNLWKLGSSLTGIFSQPIIPTGTSGAYSQGFATLNIISPENKEDNIHYINHAGGPGNLPANTQTGNGTKSITANLALQAPGTCPQPFFTFYVGGWGSVSTRAVGYVSKASAELKLDVPGGLDNNKTDWVKCIRFRLIRNQSEQKINAIQGNKKMKKAPIGLLFLALCFCLPALAAEQNEPDILPDTIEIPIQIIGIPKPNFAVVRPKCELNVTNGNGDVIVVSNEVVLHDQALFMVVHTKHLREAPVQVTVQVLRTLDCPYEGASQVLQIQPQKMLLLKTPIRISVNRVVHKQIQVVLKNKVTDEPIVGQRVLLMKLKEGGGTQVFQTESDKNGVTTVPVWLDQEYVLCIGGGGPVPDEKGNESTLPLEFQKEKFEWLLSVPVPQAHCRIVDAEDRTISDVAGPIILTPIEKGANKSYVCPVKGGEFSIYDLPAGKYIFSFSPDSLYPSTLKYQLLDSASIELMANPAKPQQCKINMVPRLLCEVKLVLQDSKEQTPIVAAKWSLSSLQKVLRGVTDETGEFIVQVPKGNYYLVLEADGYIPHSASIQITKDDPLSIHLVRGYSLSVKLLAEDKLSKKTIAFLYSAVDPEKFWVGARKEGGDHFEWKDIPEGAYVIAGKFDKGAMCLKAITVNGNSGDTSFALESGRVVDGSLVLEGLNKKTDIFVVPYNVEFSLPVANARVDPETLKFQFLATAGAYDLKVMEGEKCIATQRVSIPKEGEPPSIEITVPTKQ